MADAKTFDLGHGWYLNTHLDGSATVRNPEKGQRIDLPVASFETLKQLIRVNHTPNTAAA